MTSLLCLLVAALGLLALLCYELTRPYSWIPEVNHTPETLEEEHLRRILINHTGHDIGELQRVRGHWHAFTAFGWVAVSELLSGKFKGVA